MQQEDIENKMGEQNPLTINSTTIRSHKETRKVSPWSSKDQGRQGHPGLLTILIERKIDQKNWGSRKRFAFIKNRDNR